MAHKLNVTEHADELFGNIVYHLIYSLKNSRTIRDGCEWLENWIEDIKNASEDECLSEHFCVSNKNNLSGLHMVIGNPN